MAGGKYISLSLRYYLVHSVRVGVIDRVKMNETPRFSMKRGQEVGEGFGGLVAGQMRSSSPYQRGSCSSRLRPAAAPSSDELWKQTDQRYQIGFRLVACETCFILSERQSWKWFTQDFSCHNTTFLCGCCSLRKDFITACCVIFILTATAVLYL